MARRDKICGNCGGFFDYHCVDKNKTVDALQIACEAHFRYWSSYEYRKNKENAKCL